MRWLLGLLFSLGITAGLITGFVVWLTQPTDSINASLEGDAERGLVIAHISGCIACHTDDKAEGPLLAGGKALKTQFGDFVPPNITPDFAAGIGDWTIDDLSRALRLGKSPSGQFYYPAFPYDSYTGMSDQDIVDLFAWLRSVPAISEPAPNHQLMFPFSIRTANLAWQTLYLDVERFEADTTRSDAYNRGAYLVEVLGHCGACHTPRDLLGGMIDTQALAGAKGLPGGEASPAITAEALAADGWDHGSVVFALEIGMLPDGDFFGGSMTEVVDLGTSKISAEDRAAIASYLLNQD